MTFQIRRNLFTKPGIAFGRLCGSTEKSVTCQRHHTPLDGPLTSAIVFLDRNNTKHDMIVINKNTLSNSIIQINARNFIYKNQDSDMLTTNSIHGQLSYLYTEILYQKI